MIKKLGKVVVVIVTAASLAGCGHVYTREDANKVKDIIMSGDGSHVQTTKDNAYLDANLDGFISTADFVKIDKQVKEAEKVNENGK